MESTTAVDCTERAVAEARRENDNMVSFSEPAAVLLGRMGLVARARLFLSLLDLIFCLSNQFVQ
jgi:hypothetical protein